MMTEEIHLPFPAPRGKIPLVTKFRSTWLTSSLRALRARGQLEAYLALLPRKLHDTVLGSVAGIWLPVEVAIAHYEACDGLDISAAEAVAIGREVHSYAQATVFSLAVKLATGAGATPWTVFSQFRRLWERIWIGGAVGVTKLGPKEARVEVVGWPCARSAYCRHALRGVVGGMLEMFCTRVYVTELPRLCTDVSLAYRCAWV